MIQGHYNGNQLQGDRDAAMKRVGRSNVAPSQSLKSGSYLAKPYLHPAAVPGKTLVHEPIDKAIICHAPEREDFLLWALSFLDTHTGPDLTSQRGP